MHKEIIEGMAKAGFEHQYDEKWEILKKDSIDRELWIKTAEKMLLSVKFPLELNNLIRELVYGN